MAHILCMTSGLTGILNASFELVARLQAVGHTVTCASPADVGSAVRAQGLTYLQLNPVAYDPAPAVPDFSGPLRKVSRYVHKLCHAKTRKVAALKALGMDEFLAQVETVKPDLVLLDIELHEHIMALVANNFNVLLLSQWFSLWNRKGLPPLASDTIPGVGEAGTEAAMRQSWNNVILERTAMFAKKRKLSVGTDRRSVLLEYAQQVGFPLDYIRENYWPGPFSYDQLPIISMTAQELEFEHDVRPNLTYVGPMVAAQRNEPAVEPAVAKKLATVFELQQLSKKKLVYCSVSTFLAGDTDFLRKVIAAFDGKPNWLLVIGLGGKLAGTEFKNLPANVFAFDRVPQLAVLAKADLSINHGGIHTINECVHFGVPMLVYSGKRSDQNGCAARVHAAGIGLMADKDVDSVADIQAKVDTMLNTADFRLRMNQLQERITHYRENQVLESTIDAALKSAETNTKSA